MPREQPAQVALLTPAGRGAVATVVVSGPAALAVADAHFHAASGRPLCETPIARVAFGHWPAPDGEEVVVCRTAEDEIELHCHGGHAASQMIVDGLIAAGCQPITWRDWVARRYGDPLTAAAAMALPLASTERTARVLLDQVAGALSRAVRRLRDALAAGDVERSSAIVDALLRLAPVGLHLVEPWRVAVAGRPNVGKSSLINALVGYQRAIVFDQPGTTRDVVTAATAMDGWPVELADTAGWDEPRDPLAAAGARLAAEYVAGADLVLLVLDGSQPPTDADRHLLERWPQALVVLNKRDLGPPACGHDERHAAISALRGDGIAGLVRCIAGRLVPRAPGPGAAVPVDRRQVAALRAAATAAASGRCDDARRAIDELDRRDSGGSDPHASDR